MTEHLKENNIGYWKHWWRAMKCSYALWIHAWFPNVLKDYVDFFVVCESKFDHRNNPKKLKNTRY